MEGRQGRSFAGNYYRQTVDPVALIDRSVGSMANELGLRDCVLRRRAEPRVAAG